MKNRFGFVPPLLRFAALFAAAVALVFGASAQEAAGDDDARQRQKALYAAEDYLRRQIAQLSEGEDGEYAAESESAEGAEGTENAEDATQSGAPQMRRIFFSTEERQALEILRRDQAAVALEESNKIFPVILHEEPFGGGEDFVLARDEEEPLLVHAVVRRYSDGKTFLWIGDERFDVQRDGEFLDKTRHLVLDQAQISQDGVFGVDRISERRFQIRVGQSIDYEGRVRDNYPAIVVRNKRR